MLEEHIRKLAEKHQVPLDTKSGGRRTFEQLLTDLTQQRIFTEPRRKTLASYYGQRSYAVHRPNAPLEVRDVQRALEGIRELIAVTPT